MENDYITRRDAKAVIQQALYDGTGYGEALDAVPAADVRPVVRGEWEEVAVIDAYDICGVKTWASKMRCSKCSFTTFAIEGKFTQYNLCPNCGADMRPEPPKEVTDG